MSPLLQQFLIEARDFLQEIGEKLMALESQPDDAALMNELFRLVHTLKGNSGLFDFPEMTRVLHAGEDLMDAVRSRRLPYSQEIADRLLDAMDYVGAQIDAIEASGAIDPLHIEQAEEHVLALRELMPVDAPSTDPETTELPSAAPTWPEAPPLAELPEGARLSAFQSMGPDHPVWRVLYHPAPDCFFKGEDPFYQARQTPGLVWGRAWNPGGWPPLAELDCYQCALAFDLLVCGPRASILEHFRYVPNEIRIEPVNALALVVPQGDPGGGPVDEDFVAQSLDLVERGELEELRSAAAALLELTAPKRWAASVLRWLMALLDKMPEDRSAIQRLLASLKTGQAPAWIQADCPEVPEAPAPGLAPAEPSVRLPDRPAPSSEELALIEQLIAVQRQILELPDQVDWLPGRLKGCAATLRAALTPLGLATPELDQALAAALAERSSLPLAVWLQTIQPRAAVGEPAAAPNNAVPTDAPEHPQPLSPPPALALGERTLPEEEPRFGRRAEDAPSARVLKVDQAKIDRLMNLIGEMVVTKNSLPYLARRAEDEFGVRELAREIKAQYTVINRIAEEMQDAIMQVRLLPVSFIFQRFPRLVRDLSRKLGKEIELVLEGEETEADKSIIESLADPLIHLVRNSLDHGIELPEIRRAAGKPPAGRLLIRAQQESDRVLIEISDDGRGIDPAVIKRKVYERGLIDESQLERLSDQEAQNLIFAPGFSTAEQVTDLSGRGVGMDVVRTALERVGGTVELHSQVGRGTIIRLSLPLSMAVTNVMIIESDDQIFGMPMDTVVETVRLPQGQIHGIKHRRTAVLRGKIVPLVALNDLLAIPAAPRPNAENELAVLVVRAGSEVVGLLVDDFREVIDVILKPLPGELSKLACYAGTALLGDGSVLMVLNPKGLL
ncbi:chemotaxis protein CheA [Caldichromatium japonicum]|uniref:Chemotaxis protein CheA n=1 Tax=Caldichromatium japonicum TaxID=2699430 RepID=A0A6G7V9D7_9GAMM|nr:chemotaxis protein CheA [Caldichromatium japonicum]QIK36669.1 chemotaxis protein CheA [Caldichromatium japonicum]